jgi:5'-nucleotidase
MKRRDFISTGLKAGMALSVLGNPLISVGRNRSALSILYTNDWHSRVDPFPMDGGRYQGLGGASKRSALLKEIRKTNKHTLLLDSGDMWQGTPYFNFFKGEIEYKLMSEMRYDAVTLGNHDFDAGLDGLLKQLPLASFDILTCNYDFSNTILKNHFKPYKVFVKGGTRIGVFGIGIELKNLVPLSQYDGVIYQDPIKRANHYASHLRESEKCDLIICLSHLGYSYKNDKVSDIRLAKESEDIDLILGGHTHTFLETLIPVVNKKNQVINISQTGWAGINLGKIDFERDSILNSTNTSSPLLKIN